ncbi:MAG TPA: ROK family protein [bacterium]|nr:ROK family protein [bacterium]
MSDDIFVGIDCGGTNLRIAAADEHGGIIRQETVCTGDAQERENGLGQAILSLVNAFVSGLDHEGRYVAGIGIGLPFVCWNGKAHLCRNVLALDPDWLETEVMGRVRAPVYITNDVKCAALGESWLGAARNADPFVYLNVGTGLSSAFYADGRVYQGAHRAAGEIGYWVTDPDAQHGLEDGVGPLEEAMSGVGLSGFYRSHSPAGELASAEEIFARAERGDQIAIDAIEHGLRHLLPSIANLLTFIDPEMLVIGGGVSAGLIRFTDRIETYVGRMTPFPPRIVWSALGGLAGIIGAIRFGMLARDQTRRDESRPVLSP